MHKMSLLSWHLFLGKVQHQWFAFLGNEGCRTVQMLLIIISKNGRDICSGENTYEKYGRCVWETLLGPGKQQKKTEVSTAITMGMTTSYADVETRDLRIDRRIYVNWGPPVIFFFLPAIHNPPKVGLQPQFWCPPTSWEYSIT